MTDAGHRRPNYLEIDSDSVTRRVAARVARMPYR